MTKIKQDLVVKSRKKRQKILEQVAELLEWRHDLLNVTITELIDELAETRDGVVAIEDVNQAYLTLHGVTRVRRAKDQALFWLSSVQHHRDFQSIGRVVDDLWKKEHYRMKVTKKLTDALQPLPLVQQLVPRIPMVDLTIEKLRELIMYAIPHVDLRLLLSDQQASKKIKSEASESTTRNLSEIKIGNVSLFQELSWLSELKDSWNELVTLLQRDSFPLIELRSSNMQPRDFILALQLLGLLIDLGLLQVDTNENVSAASEPAREFFKSLAQRERWDANAFLQELLHFLEANKDVAAREPTLVNARSIIMSTTTKGDSTQSDRLTRDN